VSGAGTVGGRERLRLFCALTLPDDVLDRLCRWQQAELVCDARLVPREHLHLTLAFLGGRPAGELEGIAEALRGAAAEVEGPLVLEPVRYRETRSVGMLVLADEDGRATRLAGDLHGRLERLGVYRREARPWLPHATVVRFRRPPRLRPAVPDLGRFSPSGAAVYHSLLRPTGAQYEILERFALGG
jgi:RNA 2',3'-cyclic 3'-phosphodiesterase